MAIVRWSPVRDVFGLRDEMNRMLEELRWPLNGPYGSEGQSVWQAPLDVEETTDGFTVRAELPGMKLEDIKISLVENQLVIRAEKRREVEKKETTYHRVERAYGQFERTLTLPSAVRSDKIEAMYRDGVLEVSIPKAEEAKSREIPVKTAK
jgi:HSP20 family protein